MRQLDCLPVAPSGLVPVISLQLGLRLPSAAQNSPAHISLRRHVLGLLPGLFEANLQPCYMQVMTDNFSADVSTPLLDLVGAQDL